MKVNVEADQSADMDGRSCLSQVDGAAALMHPAITSCFDPDQCGQGPQTQGVCPLAEPPLRDIRRHGGKAHVEARCRAPRESFRTFYTGCPPPRGGGQTLQDRKSRKGGAPFCDREGSRHSRHRVRCRGKEGSRRRTREEIVPVS